MKKFLRYVLLYGLVEAVRDFVVNKIWAKSRIEKTTKKE